MYSKSSLQFNQIFGISARERPEILQETKMKLWSDVDCSQAYRYTQDSMLCAGYESKKR